MLLDSFLRRTAASAPAEARRVVGDFFRAWAGDRRPTELANRPTAERLAALVDTDPGTFLPLLRRLVDSASLDELRRVRGDYAEGGWGPRRTLVWLAERMAQIPEYFRHAEAILLRLALAESEPTIGNNATILWQPLFRVFLSGTAVPFPERLLLLEERLTTGSAEEAALGLAALQGAHDTMVTRMAAPAVVSGRFAPGEWNPTTRQEYMACMAPVLDLLGRLVVSGNRGLREGAQSVAIHSLRTFLAAGLLEQVRPLFSPGQVAEDRLPRLIEAIESFLRYEGAEDRRPGLPADYLATVRQWRQTLQPADPHGRLVSVVGKDRWHHRIRGGEAEWLKEVAQLAADLRDRPEFLQSELAWLGSEHARSAPTLGEALGGCDRDGVSLEAVVTAAEGADTTRFAGAYIWALLRDHPSQVGRVNQRLDETEKGASQVAFALALAGGDAARAVERGLRLVDAGSLPPACLRGFHYGVGTRQLTSEEFREVLTRIARGAHDNPALLRAALEFLAWPLLASQPEDRLDRLADGEVRDLAWALLAATFDDGGGDPHTWLTVLGALAAADPERAVHLAACASTARSMDQRDEASAFLAQRAQEMPEQVMQQIGHVLLDEEDGIRSYIAAYSTVLAALSPAVVTDWVRTSGVAGARAIARHLPRPRVEGDSAIVPEITAFVLEEFAADEETFRRFCAGAYRTEAYVGDVSMEMEREAANLRRFLDHQLPRIREWAERAVQSVESQAGYWRVRDEEDEVR